MPLRESPGTIGFLPAAGRKGRILIVDDELPVLRALRNTLQQQGYDTHECASGEQALAALQEADFDVLLCDMLMAGMDGITLLRRAQETTPELVSVLMTGKSSVESAIAALRAGVFDYVLKPFDFSTLLSVLTRAMEVRRLRSENIQLEGRVRERTAELTRTNATLQREVIERQRAEEAVRRKEEYFRSLTENALDLVALLDAKGMVRYVSPSVSSLVGYSSQEFASHHSLTFLHADDGVRVRGAFARLLETPGGTANLEYRLQHKDGSYRMVEAVFHNLLTNPAVAGVVVNARDVTERQEALRLKEEMVATVSHELRTPLSAILGFAELLSTHIYPREKQQAMLKFVLSESKRLKALINDFLDIQRLHSGRVVYHFAAVDMDALLHGAAAPFIHQEGHEKYTIQVQSSQGLPYVYADTDRIQQVMVNLLSNAIKFSPQGGKITVGAYAEGSHVKVWVTDPGLGIPREEIPRLFHKFYRVESKEMRKIGGTGLGLSLVKQIVEAHQGTVGVASEIGKGSTFFFTLPSVADSRALPVRSGSGAVIPGSSELTPFQATGTLPPP
jgi:PAS domain S-box-containing protein